VPDAKGDQVDVLLVEDDEEDYLITKDLLSQLEGTRHVLHWVSDYESALQAARASAYDVCLVDYRLGADNGIDLVRELVAFDDAVPVIVMTGFSDRDVDVEATRAGAADYLVKGEVSPALLERTIRYAMQNHANLQALREKEEGLRQAQRMEAVGQLAGGVAHDFNNLMSAVIGFSELLLMRLDHADPLRRHVEEIQRAGQRASAMTNQLLAFSRRQVLQPRVLDVNEIVTEVETLLRRLIGDHIVLVSAFEPDPAPIEADPGQLEQMIVNLAVNARDAMPHGGTLTIETASVELGEDAADGQLDLEPGDYVVLTVRDTGSGMDAQTMARAFEPFFTTKEEGKGTGLGLATVFGIVKQSGGDILVRSVPGHGTTFDVYLPRARNAVERPTLDQRPARIDGGSETILVVEDEALVRGLEEEILTQSGYNVLEADRPSRALQLAQEYAGVIHLLLTDVVMPEMSGPELAARLVAQRPGMRTLYASGHPNEEVVRDGVLTLGAQFLQKPLTPSSLAGKVREVLDGADHVSQAAERRAS
jgi:signal transduction histidine kinase